MKSTLTAVSLLAALISLPAVAADLVTYEPPLIEPSTYDWSGFYGSVFAGGGWGNKAWSVTLPVSESGPASDLDVSGGLLGAGLGYDLQMDNFVLGIEGQLYWSGIGGEEEFLLGPVLGDTTLSANIDWLALGTARVGFAADRLLVFANGGVAVAQESLSLASAEFPNHSYERDITAYGWTVGVGAQYAVTDNIALRLDYNYVDLSGSANRGISFDPVESIPVPPPPPPEPPTVVVDVEQKLHLLRAGLSVKF